MPTIRDSNVVKQYLQLPSDLPGRDIALAASITAGSSTIYDKVMAVQSWLQRKTT